MSQPPDHRRQFLTFVLMLGFFLLWINIAPVLFPSLFGPPKQPPAAADAQPAAPVDEAAAAAAPAEPATPAHELARFDHRTVTLGDAGQGDWQRLQLTSTGAAIDWQELLEKDFTTLDRQAQLRLLGESRATQLKTLAVESPAFDVPLKSHGTAPSTVEWEFVADASESIPGTESWRKAVFRFPSPDGQWEARKTYSLRNGQGHNSTESPEGYLLDVELTFKHLTGGVAELTYDLQGPVGLPLENEENTRTYRAAKAGTLEGASEDSVSFVSTLASSLVKDTKAAVAKKDPTLRTVWSYPIKWAGIDVQYFAALLIPAPGQLQDANADGQPDAYFAEVVPTVLHETDPVDQSDISLVFKSHTLAFGAEPNSEVTHKFQLFLGPKRVQLLEPFQAQKVMDFGWFAPIAKLMVGMLNFFHYSLWLPYGLAIMLLTVIVRGCMFPISKRQVANIQKMKDINPKIQELKTKYANDKEAMGRAQLELMRKHGYNPLAGCLPMFLQLPIFVGLYNGLNSAIDLRLARFLWINNLAAPDALFQLPGRVAALGLDGVQPAAVGHDRLVHRPEQALHAPPDERRAGDAVQDDERDDGRDGSDVLPRAGGTVRLLHRVEPVGDLRAEDS